MLKGKQVVFQYIISYSLVLLLPMTLVLFTYIDIMGIVERDTYEFQLSFLESNGNLVDKNLASLNGMVSQIESNVIVNQFVFLSNPLDDPKGIANISEVCTYLATYSVHNNFYDKLYVYSQTARSLVSSKSGVIRLDEYYGSMLQIENLSYDQWLSNFLNVTYNKHLMYNVNVRSGITTDKYMILAQTIPRAGEKSIANIYVFIRQKSLLDLFSSIPDLDTGWFYICNDNGEIITNNSGVDTALVETVNKSITGERGYIIENINGKKNVHYPCSEFAKSSSVCVCGLTRFGVEQSEKHQIIDDWINYGNVSRWGSDGFDIFLSFQPANRTNYSNFVQDIWQGKCIP